MDANIKTVRDSYEAFGRGDVPFILGACAEDVDWQSSAASEIPYSGKFRGKAGAAQFFQKIGAALDVKAFEPRTFIASGNAFVMISPLDDAPLKALAAKNRKLTFKPASDGRPYIAAGKPEDIRAFLKDAAREALRIRKKDDDVSVGIRDIAGAPDHSAGSQQQKDIEAVLAAVKALTPK